MTIDQTMPAGRWEFDSAVTDAFDDMLERSIPQYEVMRRAVTDLALRYMTAIGGPVVDLGCSRGAAVAPLVDASHADRAFVLLDASEPMIRAAADKYAAEKKIERRTPADCQS